VESSAGLFPFSLLHGVGVDDRRVQQSQFVDEIFEWRQSKAISAPACRSVALYYMVFRLATSSAYFFRSSAGIGIIPLSAR
jgi:hypothetical protein